MFVTLGFFRGSHIGKKYLPTQSRPQHAVHRPRIFIVWEHCRGRGKNHCHLDLPSYIGASDLLTGHKPNLLHKRRWTVHSTQSGTPEIPCWCMHHKRTMQVSRPMKLTGVVARGTPAPTCQFFLRFRIRFPFLTSSSFRSGTWACTGVW